MDNRKCGGLVGQEMDVAVTFRGRRHRRFSGHRFRHRARRRGRREEGNGREVFRQVFEALASAARVNGRLGLRLPAAVLLELATVIQLEPGQPGVGVWSSVDASAVDPASLNITWKQEYRL